MWPQKRMKFEKKLEKLQKSWKKLPVWPGPNMDSQQHEYNRPHTGHEDRVYHHSGYPEPSDDFSQQDNFASNGFMDTSCENSNAGIPYRSAINDRALTYHPNSMDYRDNGVRYPKHPGTDNLPTNNDEPLPPYSSPMGHNNAAYSGGYQPQIHEGHPQQNSVRYQVENGQTSSNVDNTRNGSWDSETTHTDQPNSVNYQDGNGQTSPMYGYHRSEDSGNDNIRNPTLKVIQQGVALQKRVSPTDLVGPQQCIESELSHHQVNYPNAYIQHGPINVMLVPTANIVSTQPGATM